MGVWQVAVALALAASAAGAQAIDAARSLHPMVHIPKKAGEPTQDAPGAPAAAARAAPRAKPAEPALKPGTVDTRTASGKPFVAVPTRKDCAVLATGDLEAQLRACAGVGGAGPATASAATNARP